MARPVKASECPECHRQTRELRNGLCMACWLAVQTQRLIEEERLAHDGNYVPASPAESLEPVPPVDNSVFSPGTLQSGQAQALWEQLWTVDDRIEELTAERGLLLQMREAMKELASFYERREKKDRE